METKRIKARELCRTFLQRGDPLGWFEALYETADGDSKSIPWADMCPNPNLVDWLAGNNISGEGKKALKIGCGLGDDAEALSRRGFNVVAFDISNTAVKWCNTRFPETTVQYRVEDLFASPESWSETFDLVLESYTLQVLPAELRADAIASISRFVAPGGNLLVICRGRHPAEPGGKMPWPLTRGEVDGFKTHGLIELSFDDFTDNENPPVRRFRAVYQRPV